MGRETILINFENQPLFRLNNPKKSVLIFNTKTTKATFSYMYCMSKIDPGVLYDLVDGAYNPFPRNVPFTIFWAHTLNNVDCNLLALVF